MVVAVSTSALRRKGAPSKPKRSVVFGKRPRTFCVPSGHYPTPLVSCAYSNHRGGSKGPVQLPQHSEEELAKALADAQEVAKECEAEDEARGCLWLLHYKFSNNTDHMRTYYNPTCHEARREEQKGDWRPSPCASEVDDESNAEMPDEK